MSSYPPPDPSAPGPTWGPPAGPSGYQPPGAAPGRYASWLERVGASVVDGLIGGAIALAALLGGSVAGTASDAVGVLLLVVGYAVAVGFGIWNLVRQGRTGQTVGKKVLGITLVRLDRPGPPGAWFAIGRYLLHIVDAIPCYLGYLWPLWDKQRQTFTDKILNTVVVAA